MGIPQVHHFGQEGLHNILVIDLLGPNLEELFEKCGRKFTTKTVCMAAKQMVSCQHPFSFILLHPPSGSCAVLWPHTLGSCNQHQLLIVPKRANPISD